MVHDSLQAYLETHLRVATNITPELIASLKATWRKDYVCRYNKAYRNDNVQISFRLSKQQYKTLISIAEEHQIKPTVYCRQLVIKVINGNNTIDIQDLKLVLLELTDSIEEAQHENESLDLITITPLLEQMQKFIL